MLLLLASACSPVDSADQTADDPAVYATCDQDLDLSTAPGTWDDVAPILGEHCTACHVDGGIAGFSLGSAEEAAAWAPAIASAVTNRTMPPYLPDTCGDCRTFKDSNTLSVDEVTRLVAWADAGAPTGDTTVETRSLPTLDHVDATIGGDMAYTPDDGVDDDYHCFVFDSPNDADTWLTGFSVNPGDGREVHHVLLYASLSDQGDTDADAFDAAEAGPGYTCYGGPDIDSELLAGWAPGSGAVNFPENSGIQLSAGHKLVLQIHYNLAQGAWPDSTSVDLELDDDISNPGALYSLAQTDLHLEPGQPEVTRSATLSVGGDANIWGLIAHMHRRGVRTGLTLGHDGEDSCMLDVPKWDFSWQQFWFYEEPVAVSTGDEITLSCTFDTSADTETVEWGEGTEDEMCIAFAYVTAR